jgi:sucrose phosphorylase
MSLLAETNVGRDINRPYITQAELKANLNKPVVKALKELIKIRNNSIAFDGDFTFEQNKSTFQLCWKNADDQAKLTIDLDSLNASIEVIEQNRCNEYDLVSLIK